MANYEVHKDRRLEPFDTCDIPFESFGYDCYRVRLVSDVHERARRENKLRLAINAVSRSVDKTYP